MEHSNPYTLFQIGELVHVEWTAMAFVLGLFAFTIYCMNKLLFQPILHDAKRLGDKERAMQISAADALRLLNKKSTEFEDAKKSNRESLLSHRETVLKDAKDQAFKILEVARETSRIKMNENKRGIMEELAGIKRKIDESITSTEENEFGRVIPDLKKIILSRMA